MAEKTKDSKQQSALDEVIDATEKNQESSSVDMAKKLITTFEEFKPLAYFATPNEKAEGKLTVGYGTTFIDGKPVKPGTKVTEKEAEALLEKRINSDMEKIRKLVTREITPAQEAVLASLAYNSDISFLRKTKFLKKLNESGWEAARSELWDWNVQKNKSTGKMEVQRGLTHRRVVEEAIGSGEPPSVVNQKRPKQYQWDEKIEKFRYPGFSTWDDWEPPKKEEEEKPKVMQNVGIFDRNSTTA